MGEVRYGTQSDLEEEIEVREPKLYKVLLLNDDFTSMEFVVNVLRTIFRKTQEDAHIIMFKIHKEGSALCGVYTFEIAETKVMQVHTAAKKNKFPLRAVMEEE